MKKRTSGFTLVEILIVVIILGILAAIVIPQFTDASEEARESTLASNLQVLRSQVGLYKIQHRDNYPDSTSSDTFEATLVNKTLEDGTVDAAGDFGPYMQQVPLNPFTDSTNPLFEIVDGIAGALDGSTHWTFDVATGAITANDGGASPDGTPHVDL